MKIQARLSGAAKFGILVMAVVFTALGLTIGRETTPEVPVLRVGEPAPQTFVATRMVTVIDAQETDRQRQAAAAAVADIYSFNEEATQLALSDISRFFNEARRVARLPVEEESSGEGEEPTTTEPAEDTGDEETTTTVAPEPPPRIEQAAELRALYVLVDEETIDTIVGIVNDDPAREEAGEEAVLPIIRQYTINTAEDLLTAGITVVELNDVRTAVFDNPPLLPLVPDDLLDAARPAVADLVATFLRANEELDTDATREAREVAAAAVPDAVVEYQPGRVVVRVGDLVQPVHLAAIQEMGLLAPPEVSEGLRATSMIAAIVVLLGAVFLGRVAGEYWRHPRLVGLFSLLIVLAAVASRVPAVVARDRIELGFLLPAALFGYLAANLFDTRVAAFMAVPVSAFTGLVTADLALTVFAGLATLAPIPLVSAVASRSQLNMAVVFSAAIQVPMAAALAWRFYGEDAISLSVVWGFIGGIVAGVVALGILPVLATVFAITTTQTLLDLTDRNHPALRRIEEVAPGTFNHSILVGSLADRAARAIGANPLLARAMAYYHDLGKTGQPRFFVENQFGVTNPHDRLPPIESARIIRRHVADGLKLAREYRIPADVAQGILTHHGTSLMRYFFHKARDVDGDQVNPADFRHRGRKPKTKEMVIVMLADATEAAARSLAQEEDPTSEGIRRKVESVITEKVEDGQLEESDVTFGELTRVKEAFVDALISHYHTRIPYPGFPGAPQPA